MQEFFDLMVDYNVVFYIGAHYHTYERLYPYIKGADFKLSPQPYRLSESSKYLVSVVEGIAGNDKSIVEQYKEISNYTAALSYNQTGYGIMRVGPTDLRYQHFSSKDSLHSVDSLTIEFG